MTTQELWQSQSVEAPRITPAYLRGRVEDANRAARWRNWYEYSSFPVALICVLVVWPLAPNAWQRAGFVWAIIATLIWALRWRRAASPAAMPADLGAIDTLRFHRRELERQLAANRGTRIWGALFLPSFVLCVYGGFVLTGGSMTKLLQMSAFVLAGVGVSAWYYESRIARLRREIELLDLMSK